MRAADRPRAVLLGTMPDIMREVWHPAARESLADLLDIHPELIAPDDLPAHASLLNEVEVILASWGMPELSPRQLDLMPKLKAVFYAAGSIKPFGRPLLERGVIVVSAWAANAVPVAEFTLAHILLALKSIWQHHRALRTAGGPTGWVRQPMTGAYGATIGLISMGMVARHLRELLRPFRLRVIAFDPLFSPAAARELGVELVPLPQLFRESDVVSLHTPLLPETVGMITGNHFAAMRSHATFINTSRGPIVREDELLAVLRDRPDLTAILDVAREEPPLPDSALYSAPNVLLTPHIAGSCGNEVRRLADLMVEECRAWRTGLPLRYALRLDQLDLVA